MAWLMNSYRFGSAPPIAQQWYLVALAMQVSGGGYLVWPRVTLAGTVGGATLATGGTATMGNVDGGGSYALPERVFDGTDGTSSPTTKGFSDRSHSTWAGYEFTSPQTVVEVRMQASTTYAGDLDGYPSAFLVQVSYDGGTTRETVAVCYCAPWTTMGQTQAFTLNFPGFVDDRSAALAWRVRANSKNAGTFATCAELVWASSGGGAQQATGGIPFVCSVWGVTNVPASALYDGGTGSSVFQQPGMGGPPFYYGYIWPGGAPSLVEARFTRSGDINDSIASASIQWSSNLWDWHTTDTYTGLTWSNPETKTWAIS
jgi:hypothetical protein